MQDAVIRLLVAVRAVSASLCPGRTPAAIKICYADGRAPLVLPIPDLFQPAPAAPQATPSEDEEPERSPARLRVVADILSVLEEARRPLTTTRILAEMARKRIEWSERTVSGALARLVEDGTLDNPPNVKPRGYRMPEWGDGPMQEQP